MFKRVFPTKLLVIGLGIIIMGYCGAGFGQPRKPPKPRPPAPPGRIGVPTPLPSLGSVIARLPIGYITVRFGGVRYFFHGGVFYKRGPQGYVVVKAPIGAIVATLPVGFAAVVIAGLTYYYYAGVYYEQVPSGYVVVEPPPEAVIEEPRAVIQPSEVASGRVSVTAHALNVRSGPAMNYPVIHQVNQNEILVIHGKAPSWLYVKLPSGEFGWVMEEYTSPVSPPPKG
jgi:hypothetical protein